MRAFFVTCCVSLLLGMNPGTSAKSFGQEGWQVQLRLQQETSEGTGRYHRLVKQEEWLPSETAIIVCDMWDSHHCYRAVLREQEFAPRLNTLLHQARDAGAIIIHAPSDCMAAYESHPARKRAIAVPPATNYPAEIANWCYQIPSEERGRYPIDQTDGGEDDTPEEHARWEKELVAAGRNPKTPWLKQIDVLEINAELDYVTDKGKEVWSILQSRGIRNVILAGVHTNMCVLGRPFGLRRLSQAGMNVVLMRDLTDTMYNPASWPYVSHFSGTDLIIDHIERFVCPTVSSEQWLGGQPFRFAADERPHVAIVVNEPEYETVRTLPLFVTEVLQRDHRVQLFFGDDEDPNLFPGIEQILDADVLLLSVRRRTSPEEQLRVFRQFVAAKKPVVGIRTANHAFHLRTGEVPATRSSWPQWDAEVFGGNYSNHYGNELVAMVTPDSARREHPILKNIPSTPFVAGGSLYVVSPLSAGTEVLMTGMVEGKQPEPVAWTFNRADGGKSFYTSLGTPADFEHPVFQQMLLNAISWAR